MLKVNEIFYSIQGESSYSGLPCVFVRLTGCNLRCSYCDTEYAFHNGKRMSVEGILRKCEEYNCKLLEITGGEPLLQQEAPILIREAVDKGYEVLLETNGSLDISGVSKGTVVIMDLKCPSSGEVEKNLFSNLRYLSSGDEVKFVLVNREDYEWSKEVLEKYALHKKCKVIFSPVYQKIDPKKIARWILEDHLEVRLQLQLHKYLGLK